MVLATAALAGCGPSQAERNAMAQQSAERAQEAAARAEAAADKAMAAAQAATEAANKAAKAAHDATVEINRVADHLEQMQRENAGADRP